MPGLVINSSPDIALLNSLDYVNACNGVISADLSPSVWIGAGILYVKGAKMQVLNPQGVIVRDYPTSYDIAPGLSGGMDVPIFYPIPTISGGYQLGKYTINVQLTDSQDNIYVVSKSVVLCAPDPTKPSLKFGTLSAKFQGNCQDGKLSVIVDTPPNYKSTTVYSQTNNFTLDYPTASQLPPISNFTYNNISVPLYEGVYLLTGTICANYNLGDDVYVGILYKIKVEHNQKCIIDLCCVNDAFTQLKSKFLSDCSDKEKADTASTIVEALFYLENARLSANCGQDPSDDITALEKLLGCSCTCNCNEGTPIINNNPVADSSIEGCGFTKATVGLTTVYTLYNYNYIVAIADNGGMLTIGDATGDGCTQTQLLVFDILRVYAQIKALAINDSCSWATIIRRCFNNFDLSCMGYTQQQVDAMTLQQLLQAIANNSCSGATCASKITNIRTEQVGRFITIKWDEDALCNSVNIYVNGILQANIAGGIKTYDYAYDAGDISIVIIPLCANGSAGTGSSLNVSGGSLLRPPFIAPPEIYSPYLQNSCPYDITTNVHSLPFGISAEYHRLNNTGAASLVGDPYNALQGVYFVFAKDGNGFYSDSVQMQLVCDASGSCSAPQNPSVVPIIGGNMVQFQSAAYPPPLNSYTVRRRLESSSDIPANYDTIGAPVWNPAASRWVINDLSAVSNVLYVYRVFSNCSSTSPYTDVQFANIVCPALTLTPKVNQIDYSFVPIGGDVDKYEISIYEDAGINLVHTDTHVIPVSNPKTGSFLYLDPNRTYFVRVKAFIGTYTKICPLFQTTTLYDTAILTVDYIGGAWLLSTNHPLAADIQLKVGAVTGYSDACITPSGETDIVNPSLFLYTGQVSASQTRNGLTYLSLYYKITNSVGFETYLTHYNGDTFNVAGATVTLQINQITCQFYPA